MKHHDIYVPGAVSTSELTCAIAGLLSRFASVSKTRDAGMQNLIHGVSVLGHVENPHLVRFGFVTPSDLEVGVVVDLRSVDRSYMDNLVMVLKQKIEDHQARRKPLELRSAILSADSGAVH